MKLSAFLLPFMITFLPALAIGQDRQYQPKCTDDAMMLSANTLKKARILLPVFRHYCYSDQSGKHVLYLTEKQDKVYANEKLSSAVEAHLFTLESDNSFSLPVRIRDKADSEEAGIGFWSKLVELKDIDGDGLIDPILVYRVYDQKDSNAVNTDAYSGRIKIILLYKGSKVVIRAITGTLDGERQTTATENFFLLPASMQKYLVKKMAKMYELDQYGFDNSYKFVPRKVKSK
ncbi:M949_RS01915 family surface polysaccharide biosynthesis protein [Undibacterium sp. TJN19]|uniref:M949_RS01915 family surface polysaccharide biosynthesis protein n=1 Tax=Undibacterium sp. TJN19 TaxID=3413055 RepID=UPI003BF20127